MRLLKGNPGKRRARVPPEPARPDRCPEPPARLSDYARQEWEAVAPELYRLGLLTVLDISAFSVYCTAAAQLRQAEELLARDGKLTFTTKTGQRRVNPLIRIASQAQADMLKFGSAFGLTPVGRLRLSGVTPPPSASKFDGLLGS
ncbi:phage terminase small subunit P27 family [Bradyrhizobium monzae]|uniref:phage terminase small subunit P27 family n=1 Tax=Bradyrhizobium sp. Oc8 TaxID=2876780 RepID=UPI001F49166B|nr:phage terminase small subunit P27 family [Bradyrhizobium sp. Oc8]